MARFMVQFSYTVAGWQALMKAPEDRGVAVRAAAEALGAEFISIEYCFGDYDGVVMVEAPDDVTAGSVVLAAIGGGHVARTKTTKLLSTAEAMEMMRKAGGIVYQAPKG